MNIYFTIIESFEDFVMVPVLSINTWFVSDRSATEMGLFNLYEYLSA